jgi:DNA-binding transcriptional regulator PaaX
MGCD